MKYLVFIILSAFTFQTYSQNFPNHDAEGLEPGGKAPDFTVSDQNGNKFNLYSQLEKGPVIVTFYRGAWCRYCMKQMKDFQDSLGLIKEKGASLIAITPARDDGIQKTVDKTNVQFTIASDNGLEVMKSFKVITDDNYNKYLAEIQSGKDNQHKYLPVPATYIIGKNRKILYRYFDPDYKVRSHVSDLLNAL